MEREGGVTVTTLTLQDPVYVILTEEVTRMLVNSRKHFKGEVRTFLGCVSS